MGAATAPPIALVVGHTKLHAAIELVNPGPEDDAQFGLSVAVAGNCVAIGAPYNDTDGLPDAGAVDIYSTSGHFVSSLVSHYIGEGNGLFGFAVAMTPTTLVVGAPNESGPSGPYTGDVYVYDVSPTCATTLVVTLPNPFAQAGEYFGYSVAISGTNAIIGIPVENVGGVSGAGEVEVVNLTTTAATFLTSENPAVQGYYGVSTAIQGTTAYVGAPGENVSGGHVYIIKNATGPSSGQTTYTLVSPNPLPGGLYVGGMFGFSIAVSGSHLIVGAPLEFSHVDPGAGNAYLYSASTGVLKRTLSPAGYEPGNLFGYSVAADGSYLAASSPNAEIEMSNGAGFVSIFTPNGKLVAYEYSPNFQDGGAFGSALGLSGRTLVIGALGETYGGAEEAGEAYVY
jgi:hypothetical protein